MEPLVVARGAPALSCWAQPASETLAAPAAASVAALLRKFLRETFVFGVWSISFFSLCSGPPRRPAVRKDRGAHFAWTRGTLPPSLGPVVARKGDNRAISPSFETVDRKEAPGESFGESRTQGLRG